jgi:BirA family biotin operon repressor/biotin-[acetyl-CoA-carboxylase] ligase
MADQPGGVVADTATDSGTNVPRLPPAYRLVVLDPGSDPRSHAIELARNDADDGTLVWTAPRNDAGADDDFRVALVLYPESSLVDSCQLLYVAMLGVGDALGVLLEPGNELIYVWPDKLVLNSGEVARFSLDHAPPDDTGQIAWVVVGMRVRVASADDGTFVDTSVLREEGWPDASADALLDQFARHFLLWVNRWLDEGFEPIRAMWMRHCADVGQAVEVALKDGAAQGELVDLDGEGSLVLRGDDDKSTTLQVALTPSIDKAAV